MRSQSGDPVRVHLFPILLGWNGHRVSIVHAIWGCCVQDAHPARPIRGSRSLVRGTIDLVLEIMYESCERVLPPGVADLVYENFVAWDIEELDGERTHIWSTSVGGELIAVAWAVELSFDPEMLWLRYLCVTDRHRGRGLGVRLLAEVARTASRLGYKKVGCQVQRGDEEQARRMAWFTRLGFHDDAEGGLWVLSVV